MHAALRMAHVLLVVSAAVAGFAVAASAHAAIAWSGSVELASGGGQRGPWQQNESRYDYVDDPTVALSPDGAAAVAWVDQRHKDEHDNVYVLWELYPDHRRHPRGLALAFSLDGGQKFSAPALVPGSSDPDGGWNGSHQGLLMRKLAVNGAGAIAVVNSSLKHGEKSRVWLMRGQRSLLQ